MIGAHELLDLIEEDDIAPPEPLDLLNDPEDEVPNRIYKDRLEFDNVPDREYKRSSGSIPSAFREQEVN